MKRLCTLFAFFWIAAAVCLTSPATAQSSVASAACSAYRDASDPADQALYRAYLQGFANASSPDPRYTQSEAALSDDARRVRDWCGRNLKSSYGEAVFAVLGPARSAAAPSYQPAPQYQPAPVPQYVEPSSCRVGPTQACSGCSVTCNGGKQATCKQGQDNMDRTDCTFQSRCDCK